MSHYMPNNNIGIQAGAVLDSGHGTELMKVKAYRDVVERQKIHEGGGRSDGRSTWETIISLYFKPDG